MNRFDIIVALPSLNEEDSIGRVLRTVDSGLVKFFPKLRNLIINVDQSSDNTRINFMKTTTTSPKKYIYTGPTTGKGKNLFKFLKYGIKSEAKYFCTFDTDVESIQENWVHLLLTPLVTDKADFVTPLYARNKYEGNSTNHFFFPIIKAFFGLSVRQPIGGEYSFTSQAARFISIQKRNSETEEYGIDPFLTINAIAGNFRLKEVFLGKKIHKPSFNKILPMFKQMSATAFYLLSQYKNHDMKKMNHKSSMSSSKEIGILEEGRKPTEHEIMEKKNIALQQIRSFINKPRRYLLPLDGSFLNSTLRNPSIDKYLWVEVLYWFLKHVKENKINASDATRLSELITPYFLLRVLTYFDEIEDLSSRQIENIFAHQAELLSRRMSMNPFEERIKR